MPIEQITKNHSHRKIGKMFITVVRPSIKKRREQSVERQPNQAKWINGIIASQFAGGTYESEPCYQFSGKHNLIISQNKRIKRLNIQSARKDLRVSERKQRSAK